MPRASIIIPTYNRSALLKDCIQSARHAGSDLEIIVVDNASTDDTAETCRKLCDIRYIRLDRNYGPGRARNAAIAECTSEYVAFLDDDDLRLPGSIDSQLRVLESCPEAAMVYGRAFLADSRYTLPTGQIVPAQCPTGDVYWLLLTSNFINVSTVVARRSCLRSAGLFREDLKYFEDYDLWLRTAEKYPVKAVVEPVVIYRLSGRTSGQISSDPATANRLRKAFLDEHLQSFRARAASWRLRRRVRRRHLSDDYAAMLDFAGAALTNAELQQAQEYLKLAMRLQPTRLRAPASLLWLYCSEWFKSTE